MIINYQSFSRSLLPTWSVPACCNPYHGIVLQMRARTTSLVTSFSSLAVPAIRHHRIRRLAREASSWNEFRCNLKLDTGEPSAVWWMHLTLFDAHARYNSLTRWVGLPDCTASFWDLACQSVEQYVMNGPNPLFMEYCQDSARVAHFM